MGFYMSASGYYEGDRVSVEDFSVPQRPGSLHEWDDGVGEWIIPLAVSAAVRIAAIDAERDRLLKAGKLFAGLHVALLDKQGSDGPRADLGGMATTAGFVLLGIPGVSWPASFQLGWIAVENDRIPLATPAEGLALAASAGDYFAAVVQCARDKKDACLAAETAQALDAVSITEDWPENTDPLA